MSYIEQFFGKKAQDLVYHDIVKYFLTEQIESDKIEFKSYNTNGKIEEKYDGILRTVCGFLNSAGGLIIWGAPKVHKKDIGGRNVQVTGNALEPLDKFIEKDAFISKVVSSITPSPNGVLFYCINDGNNYIYLIDVPQSVYSPHQFSNAYYMRMDGQTKYAPHHYIDALFKKITYPKLRGGIMLESMIYQEDFYILTITGFIFNFSKLQNEEDLEYRILVTNGVKFQGAFRKHDTSQDYNRTADDLRVRTKDILYYKQPLKFSEILQISGRQISIFGNTFQILLNFGGKKSPLVSSWYKIRLNLGSWQNDKLNEFIIEQKENVYMFENSGDLEITDDETLELVLGRKK